MTSNYINYSSPIGLLYIAEHDGFITEVSFMKADMRQEFKRDTTNMTCNTPNTLHIAKECARELDAYFAGKLKVFTIPVKPKGTPFRMQVWQALTKIPFGETISYKELAHYINNPKAIRAVGGANHHNPISIIIPCHRVIGADGSLTGYGGGLDNKRYLLELEANYTTKS